MGKTCRFRRRNPDGRALMGFIPYLIQESLRTVPNAMPSPFVSCRPVSRRRRVRDGLGGSLVDLFAGERPGWPRRPAAAVDRPGESVAEDRSSASPSSPCVFGDRLYLTTFAEEARNAGVRSGSREPALERVAPAADWRITTPKMEARRRGPGRRWGGRGRVLRSWAARLRPGREGTWRRELPVARRMADLGRHSPMSSATGDSEPGRRERSVSPRSIAEPGRSAGKPTPAVAHELRHACPVAAIGHGELVVAGPFSLMATT
jgi:hypothetical protein